MVLRRRKEEVLKDLPARLVSRLAVPMTAEQAALHEDAERDGLAAPRHPAEAAAHPGGGAAAHARLPADAHGLRRRRAGGQEDQAAPKLDELERLLEEICLRDGRKVVVFSEWERMQAMAAEVCDRVGVGYVRLHGGVPSNARGRLIDRFREDPTCQVFLSTDAGGVGLNLQVASHVVNLDLPWNPAVLAQRIARVHRLGQREAVNVVLLVSEGSFEQRMEGTLDGKRALFAAAVGDDRETVELERSSMARRIATLLSGEFAASTGSPRADWRRAREPRRGATPRVGASLEQVLRLADGRLLGLVRGDAAPRRGGCLLLTPASSRRLWPPSGAPRRSPARAALPGRARRGAGSDCGGEAGAALDGGAQARRRDRADGGGPRRRGAGACCATRWRFGLPRGSARRGDPGEEPAALLSGGVRAR